MCGYPGHSLRGPENTSAQVVVTRDLLAAELFRIHQQTGNRCAGITLPDIDDFRIRRPQRFVLKPVGGAVRCHPDHADTERARR